MSLTIEGGSYFNVCSSFFACAEALDIAQTAMSLSDADESADDLRYLYVVLEKVQCGTVSVCLA